MRSSTDSSVTFAMPSPPTSSATAPEQQEQRVQVGLDTLAYGALFRRGVDPQRARVVRLDRDRRLLGDQLRRADLGPDLDRVRGFQVVRRLAAPFGMITASLSSARPVTESRMPITV